MTCWNDFKKEKMEKLSKGVSFLKDTNINKYNGIIQELEALVDSEIAFKQKNIEKKETRDA
jgi:predicted AlkP superfamily phosphohydrolase/phosphomutase